MTKYGIKLTERQKEEILFLCEKVEFRKEGAIEKLANYFFKLYNPKDTLDFIKEKLTKEKTMFIPIDD